MKQYLDLLKTIKEKGTKKPAAREGMPGTTSLFGYQFRHDLSEGFPMLTTKKLSFKNIVVELLWFLKGDTNIKYLIDNGCNIWNEDAYNFYLKQIGKNSDGSYDLEPMSFEQFVDRIKNPQGESRVEAMSYKLGDCGKQYGWLWRNWDTSDSVGKSIVIDTAYLPVLELQDIDLEKIQEMMSETGILPIDSSIKSSHVDQIKELIKRLRENPMSRRHIITAWNPATLNDMALNACHALVQFNCRPIPWEVKLEMAKRHPNVDMENLAITEAAAGNPHFGPIPQYYLDCQMYQRSCDVFLGCPYNIASYALLTHLLCEICGMIPGEFIHTFGDVHIYDNHMEQVTTQLSRSPKRLPKLDLSSWIKSSAKEKDFDLDKWLNSVGYEDFGLEGYDPDPGIKAKLSTGLK